MKLKLYFLMGMLFIASTSFSQTATHLNFDGVDDRVELSNESNFDFTSTFSIEAWIRVASFTQEWQTVISKGAEGPRIHRFGVSDFIAFGTGPADDLVSTVSVNDGNWHHIAATCNNGFKSLYVDGVLQGTQTVGTPLITNNDNVRIGSQIDSYSPIRAFHGDIDDVRFWSVAKTQTEINNSKNLELVGNETGLVAYYNFNQGINAGNNVAVTTAIDATGTNNGTVTNFTLTGATSNWISGPAATHLNFDGVNDYVELPNESNYDFTTNLTIEFMVRTSNLNVYTSFVSKGNGSWRVQTSGDGLIAYAANGAFVDFKSSTRLDDNNWHHVAVTYDGAFARIYIDGVLENSRGASGTITNTSHPVVIGAMRETGPAGRYLNGDIDEVRIWNVARTATQIANSRNCELQGNETGLVSYYKFNQGFDATNNTAITTLTDATASANNGILTNFELTRTTSNWLAGSPIDILPSVATVTTPVTYTQGATATALTATVGANGSNLLWYSTATGGTGTTAPTPSTATVGSTSYWVSSTNANGCESARTEIVVTVIAPATHLNFDGVNDYVELPNESNFDFTTNLTVEFMVRTSNLNVYTSFVSKGNGSWRVQTSGDGLIAYAANGAFVDFKSTTRLDDNNWHHVAVTYDGAFARIYIDGVLENSRGASGTITNTSHPVVIGAMHETGPAGRYLNGDIDEVRIWNKALSASDILALKDCELQNGETGLVAYYKFNQGNDSADNTTITTLTDASGNANNGTLTNFARTGTTSNFLLGSPMVTGTTCTTLNATSFDVASNINIYPNPTNGNVNIMVNNLTNVSVSVYDLNGRQILNKEVSNNTNTIDISNLQTGMYLFRIKSSEGEVVKKVIKN
ncbi:LamG-like jellyroll fold domain-containing protein [Flavobacterium helocola]|uniref:LamG-like jellyroll fold domain-containing protein n=1 Tax=Flavobacterium helocola TaxID=3139139 RepID=A0ABU9I403_9FLAO